MNILMKEFEVLRSLFSGNNSKMGILRVNVIPCAMANDNNKYMVLAANSDNDLIVVSEGVLYKASALCNTKQDKIYLYSIKPISFGDGNMVLLSLPQHINALYENDIDKIVDATQRLLDLTRDKEDYIPEYIPITPKGYKFYEEIVDSLDRPCDDIDMLF